jgi:deoxycytidylate deaminase
MVKNFSAKNKEQYTDVIPVAIFNPELVFGIVGPIGVDLEAVVSALSAALQEVKYQPILIHLTSHMENKRINTKIDASSYFLRYMSLIKYANEYRKLATNPAALAGLAILHIRRNRAEFSHSQEQPALGKAYLVRQFKRPEEIELMRRAYGRKFVQVSVFGSEIDRRSVLIRKIQHFDPSPKSDAECESKAIELIDVDNNQVDDTNGQRVSDVFHLGDVFVDGIDAREAATTIRRFIRAFFGDNRISPNKDEYGLYTAAASALRSIDLSRQVGAAIFSKDAEIISLGCNEVPKPKGGTYWSDDVGPTFRDIEIGSDANQDRKYEIFYDLVGRLSQEGLLSQNPSSPGDLKGFVDEILIKQRIKESQFMDLLEFGRMIHAEMSAISDAARLGRATREATLYSTTFPCHLCAKHIVAAGIDRVVFLEPYPKSYAKKLHEDSITFEPQDKSKVLFQPFMGISPRRYRDIFEKRKRKDDGGVIREWYEGRPVPRIEDRSSVYIENEEPLAFYALGALYGRPRAVPRKH